MGINIKELAQNSLDVSGNVSIGTNLTGLILAENSVMVESKLGVGTYQPVAHTEVRGAMVVGKSTSWEQLWFK